MMKRLVVSTALALSAVWSTACTDPDTPPKEAPGACQEVQSSLSHEEAARIDQFVTERMQQGHIPGLSLVILREGKPVYVRGYGTRDVESDEPMTGCSRVSVGSTTKSMTALALMQLVEQGKVDLEAPVTRYIPWFQTADGRGGNILVKHVLSHTAGLPTSSLLEDELADDALERRVRGLSEVNLVYAPGKGFQYANQGYAVAGFIIQTVSGKPYEQYMAEHVFQPLGMKHTTFGPPQEETADLAQGYVWTRGDIRPAPILVARAQYAAGTATYASAQDTSAYLAAMLAKGQGSHGRVLSAESLDRMWKPEAVLSQDSAYGLGWFVETVYGRRAVYHNGSVVGSGSMFMLFPEDNLAVATIANLNGPPQEGVARGVAALLLGAEPPPAVSLLYRPPSTFVPDPSVWQKYVGEYSSPLYGRMNLRVESGRLMGTMFYASPPLEMELEAYGDNDFFTRNELGMAEGLNVSFRITQDGQTFLLVDGQPLARKL